MEMEGRREKRIRLNANLSGLMYMRTQIISANFWTITNLTLLLIILAIWCALVLSGKSSNFSCAVAFTLTAIFATTTFLSYTVKLELVEDYNAAVEKAHLKRPSTNDVPAGAENDLEIEMNFLNARIRPPQSHPYENSFKTLPTYVDWSKELHPGVLPSELVPDRIDRYQYVDDIMEFVFKGDLCNQVFMTEEDFINNTGVPIFPIPTDYPPFKRRKDRYFLSDVDDAMKFLKELNRALENQEVRYCFHKGVKKKYLNYLKSPSWGFRSFQELCQRIAYQNAPIPASESSGDPCVFPINHGVWRTFKINPQSFVNWIANIRVWIAKTILHRLVIEIDSLNERIKFFAPTMSIGNVGLDELISLSRNQVIMQNMPTLNVLLPYLQISTNQKYVVQRIRDLAVGNTMSDFFWNGGGKLEDKPWEPHLPCDAELIMHFVLTYLDSQMPITIECPNRKRFSSHYFAKHPDPIPASDIVIYQQKVTPPHFQLIVNNEVCSLPSGAYNMFFSILLFLHYIQHNHNGIVGRMYLGESGLNILWTIQDLRK